MFVLVGHVTITRTHALPVLGSFPQLPGAVSSPLKHVFKHCYCFIVLNSAFLSVDRTAHLLGVKGKTSFPLQDLYQHVNSDEYI